MSVNDLAEHVLAVAHRSEKTITNLELQKVLFFLGMSIRHNVNELKFFEGIYDDDFEKWRYGPVVPELYFRFNIFGDKPIQYEGKYDDQLLRFDDLIIKLLNIDVYRLVALSHKMDAWAQYEDDILAGRWVKPYTLKEIVKDFRNAK